MSALQLRALIEHVTNNAIHGVMFAFKGGRLFIKFTDDGGNKFNRSFGTDGSFVEHEILIIGIGTERDDAA